MEETLKQILVEMKTMNHRLDGMEKRFDGVDSRLASLEIGQKRLGEGQAKLQKNLVDSLGSYTEKIVDYVDNKTEALNKRVFTVETDIQRLFR
jgi:chaperonin cofactor prefoldin